MEIAWLLAQFAFFAGLIVFAGQQLARASEALAALTGLGRTLVGVILLAAATSMPELAVDCTAAVAGTVDFAMGDILGSSLMNLLILGLLDVFFRPRGRLLSRLSAGHTFTATMSLILTVACLATLLLRPGTIPYLRVSVGSLAIVGMYLLLVRMLFFDEMQGKKEVSGDVTPEIETNLSLRRAIALYLGATAIIFISAQFLVPTAEGLADQTGIGKTFIGSTLLAITTSLPEAVTTWTAVRMGAYDLAIGNIFGSNTFNITILPAVDLFYSGSLFADVSATHAVSACAVVLVTGVAMLGLTYRVERRKPLIEPDATMLILLVLSALGLVYYLGDAASL